MAKTGVITARIDEETLALVDRVSRAHNRSRGWFAARAIAEAARREAEFLAFVEEGIEAADRGDVLSQEEMERWLEQKMAKHEARG